MLKTVSLALLTLLILCVAFAAFSHRLLPADMDECQQDVSHLGHVSELPLFHCIGHSETNRENGDWDHQHPWMTEEWHAEHGFVNSSSLPAPTRELTTPEGAESAPAKPD